MQNINVSNFRKDIFNILERTIKYSEPVNISTKNGNVVVVSEDDYNGMIETLYLTSIPGMEKKIIDGLNTPIEECVQENEVEW